MNLEDMKKRKKELGYSFKQLAEFSGVPLGTVQKIFNGETKSPRFDTLRKLEAVLKDNSDDVYRRKANVNDNYLEKSFAFYNGKEPINLEYFNEKKQGEYTIEDYMLLPDDIRVELIDGRFYLMSAPSAEHQLIASEIYYAVRKYIDENKGDCIPYLAPTDVQLDKDDKTILQPDFFIVCDPTKRNRMRIFGQPDLVVEVLSSSTGRKDRYIKSKKYKDAGVKEYWIVDPLQKTILVYLFDNISDNDEVTIYGFSDKVPMGIYEGKLEINFAEIDKYLNKVCPE
ncbi:Uma2 family endonuclease [Butyrivibrio sp. AE3004]|uniref:Uma2 family endonuclease n=1 Tax=Butyrivibrio sp. AE3004 TaxID=1506994 RepID=UPI000494410A|nr:Uma2 family endonuclease [Butyrivibrio sp. AE3004]